MNDEFLVRVLSGTAGPWETDELRCWRSRSPENEAYYQATLRAWKATAPAPRARRVDPSIVDVIVEAAEGRTGDLDRLPSGPRPIRNRPRAIRIGPWLGLAAGLAAVAVAVRALGPAFPADTGAVWTADGTGARTVSLPDGTLARVAPGGRLRQLASPGTRHYLLDGKALFAVAHDEQRAFVVETASARVRVLGTRFEVATSDGGTRVVVLDGTVNLSNGRGSVTVAEGGAAYAPGEGPPTELPTGDARTLLDWPGGVLLFQATPLSRVAEDVARHFGRPVIIRDASVGVRTLTGSFGPETFEEVIESVCATTGIACTVSDSAATLRAP